MRTALVLAVVSLTGLRVAKLMQTNIAAILSGPRNVDWEAARGLSALGIQPGDRVSILSLTGRVYWARQAAVTVVSEIPLGEGTAFWTADADAKRRVFQVFADTGAKFVITENPPPGAISEGWIPLGRTDFFAYPLTSLIRTPLDSGR